MNRKKEKALEAAGWRSGDAADFLEMSDAERLLLDIRAGIGRAIRLQRTLAKMTQQQLAARLGTSQPRVVKIEQAAADVSLDQIVRALAEAGGHLKIKMRGARNSASVKKGTRPPRAKADKVEIELLSGE